MPKGQFGETPKLRSGRYQARFLHPYEPYKDGKRNYVTAGKTFSTKGTARAWLNQQDADIQRGVWKSPEELDRERIEREAQARRDAYTFGEHAEVYIHGAKLRASTERTHRANLRNHLLPRWGDVPLKDITTKDVGHWLHHELSPDHQGARKKAFQLFRAILANAVESELIGRNPCIKAHAKFVNVVNESRRHEPRKLTEAEVNAIIANVAKSTKLIVQLLAHTGLRIGELRELRRDDIDLDTGAIYVRRGVTGDGKALSVEPQPKTKAGIRTLYFGGAMLDDLRHHIAGLELTGRDALIFPSPTDPAKHFEEKTIRKNIARACQKAGIDHCSPHDLRNTFATFAGRLPGVSVKDVQAALGHTTATMALRYMRTDEEQQRKLSAGVSTLLQDTTSEVGSLDERRASN